MSRKNMGKAFRDLLAEKRITVKPGAYDALSARMIEAAGFESLGVSGYAVSAALLGKPDCGLVTLDEMVMVSRYVQGAVNIPAIADADTGHGNAINVMRTVEDFIRAGVGGIHIEDQVAPKRCGHVAGKQIIPVEEAAGKYRAAAKVRDELDPDFVLIARTDARGVAGGSVEAVIERAKAYLDAGVDMIFPEGLTSKDELAEVCDRVAAPIHYNRTGVSPMLSLDELNALGVSMVSNATGSLRCAARAMWDYMQGFKAEDVEWQKAFLADVADHPVGDFHGFMGFDKLRALEEEFLPTAELLAKYEGSVGYQPPAGINERGAGE
jgi:2-methylisocitrate lyase-like PEP mutase family enzyme